MRYTVQVLSTYEVSTPRMTAEIIDGEVMIVDFLEGHYYNLLGSSALTWALLEAGLDAAQVCAILEAHYAKRDLIPAVTQLIAQLEAEGLIRVAPIPATPRAVDVTAFSHVYTGLSVEKFSDMQELLLLDPIHDVDPSGWPRVSP